MTGRPDAGVRFDRPTKAGAAAMVGVALATTLALGSLAGVDAGAALALAGGLALAAGCHLLGRPPAHWRAIGAALATLGLAPAALALATVEPRTPPLLALVAAAVVVGWSAGLGAVGGIGGGAVLRSTRRYFPVLVPPGLALVAVFAIDGGLLSRVTAVAGDAGAWLGGAVLAPAGEPGDVAVFVTLLAAALALARHAARIAAVGTLLSGRQRERIAPAADRADRVVSAALPLLAVLSVVTLVLAGGGALGTFLAPVPPALSGALVGVAAATPLRYLLVVAVLVGLAATAGRAVVRRARRLTLQDAARGLAPASGGALAAAGLVAAVGRPSTLARIAPALPPEVAAMATDGTFGGYGLALVLVTAGLALLPAAFVAAAAAVGAGFLPDRAGGPALAAAATFAVTLARATVDPEPVSVFAGFAAAVFVWDAGEYATGLGEEIGRGGESAQGEFVHLGATALVGAVAVAAAVAASGVVIDGAPAVDPAAATLGLVAAFVGALLLIGRVRG